MAHTIFYHNFLRQITGEEKLEDSLFRIVPEYLKLKIDFLERKKQEFETTYGMNLDQYEDLVLGGPIHKWEDELVVMEWYKTITLLENYQDLLRQWERMKSRAV
jgi:hypothetical protein